MKFVAFVKRLNPRHWPVTLIVMIPIVLLIYIHMESYILYHRIDYGLPRSMVLEKFGQPDRAESTMLFCERIFHWRGECPNNVHQGYIFYRTGIDRWVVIGFDTHGRVAFKTKGSL